MSAQIRQERPAYYEILEQTQSGTMDVTGWMEWFIGCLGGAIDAAQTSLGGVLAVLGEGARGRTQRTAATGAEQVAGRFRGKTDHIEVRKACQMVAGYCVARYTGIGGSRSSGPQPGGRPKQQLRNFRTVEKNEFTSTHGPGIKGILDAADKLTKHVRKVSRPFLRVAPTFPLGRARRGRATVRDITRIAESSGCKDPGPFLGRHRWNAGLSPDHDAGEDHRATDP